MSPARINRRYAWLIVALLSACSGERKERDAVVIDAGVPDSDLPDSDLPDSGPPDASNDASVDAPADAPDADPPASHVTVTRYQYRFGLASGEARSKLTFDGFGAQETCVQLASALPLREPTTEGLTDARVEQHDGLVSLCGTARGAAAASLTADVTVPDLVDKATGVGLSRKLDAHGNQFSYLLGWVEACDRFGPCDPAPGRLSHFQFDVSHPAGETVLCPGTRRATSERTICELLDARAPTYSSFAIAANSAWVREPLVSAAGVAVVLYEVPEGRVRAALDSAAVGAFLEWVTARLGPFPYGEELRVATAPVPWLGIEHPANIVLRDDLTDIQRLYANVPLHALLHEIAHQWAGNRTTLADALDFIWKEAIAEYLVYAFEQELRPTAESLTTRDVWHSTGNGAPYPVRPLSPPDVPLSVWTAGGYGSGPMTLFVQLEPWLGQAALLSAIGRFLEGDVRSMLDLRVALEAESGLDLQRYFDAWVFGTSSPEWPIFQVEATRIAGGNRLRINQEHASDLPFPCVVELDLVGTTRSERVRADFGLSPQSSTLVIDTSFDEPITRVLVDPDKRLLDFSLPAQHLVAPELRWHP
ncbi:MAG TPA: M1 family aminopeptidase [Polyangiaceae bacterium]|nr:M1 family aminopeptidase [Polyangiaceae bacterium]